MIKKTHYRLGIDMGSTSIGWAMILLDESNEPCGLGKMGVRIFPDGREDKTKVPLSVSRRMSRGARRNHDRYLQRMRGLLKLLDECGLMPTDKQARADLFKQNPYELRARGLDAELSLGEFARALLHLAKRRGFKSNRKTDTDAKATDFMTAIQNLAEQLENSGARTIGEHLYLKYASCSIEHDRPSLRFRYDSKEVSEQDRIFPRRDMVEHEFELLWTKQAEFHKELRPSLKEEVYHAIFYQRPLKPVEKGKCFFEPDEPRAPKAHPLFQEFRILQDLNNLELEEVFEQRYRALTTDERQKVLTKLLSSKEVKFSSLRNELFGAQKDDYKFNYETENRDKLLGDQTAHIFKNKNKPELGKLWQSLSGQERNELIELLLSDDDDETLMNKLVNRYKSDELAKELFYLSLPSAYCNISLKALGKLLPHMRNGAKYHDACKMAGYDHSEKYNGVVYHDSDLPYYGALLKRSVMPLARPSHDPEADKYGKINNPTVHIALNQIRKIINALEKVYGPPQQIVLELARDLKMGQDEKADYNKRITRLTKNNERIAKELEALGIENSYINRTKYKLWEELSDDPLERRCVYTGKGIPLQKLFSDEFEIEHILPKSRTYDDSISNKTISYRGANRYKGERSPYEAFGASIDGYDWDAIASRASKLPENKRRRFLKDSMARYADESEVLARMLNDTRYMSRVARDYLQYVVGDRNIWVVTGQQTSMFRAKWGLNKVLSEDGDNTKNRSDHRHHAIDAFVIGMMSRSVINRFSRAVKNSRERYLENLGDPYPGFSHESFQEGIDSIKVSYKPDHLHTAKLLKRNQTAGSLVKETAYGYIGEDPDSKKYHLYTERVAVKGLKIKDVDKVVDPVIRKRLASLASDNPSEKDFSARLKAWSEVNNVKKIKLVMKGNPDTMISIRDKAGKIYKHFSSGENLFADIYCCEPWNKEAPWMMEIVNSYDAHQPNFTPKWKRDYPMAKLIMRLYKNDTVAFDCESGREFRRVRKMTMGIVYLRELNISQKPQGSGDVGEQFNSNRLKSLNACKAGIDEIGRAYDPYSRGIDAGIGDQS